jgi:predicted metal-dependent peptidase
VAERVEAVRMELLRHHPFWGHLLRSMEVAYDDSIPAIACTDGIRNVWLNPEPIAQLSQPQLGFVLLHELGHVVLASMSRRQGRDWQLWNRATDYAINRIVAGVADHTGAGQIHQRYEPVLGCLLDTRFDGLTAEQIYDVLLTEAPKSEQEKDSTSESQGTDRTPSFQGASDHGGGIDVHAAPRLTPQDREEIRDRIRAALWHRAQEGGRGNVPGTIERTFGEASSRVPWSRVLRRYAEAALAKDELDPRRPNRRWMTRGVVLPGLSADRVREVVVALDTSGSMCPKTLALAAAEIRRIAEQADSVHIVVADAEVQETVAPNEVEAWLARRKYRGGGGTDHRPVFEWIAAQGIRPSLFIGITDLFTALPEARPPWPVVWLVPQHHNPPPWGRVVVAHTA